MIYPYRHVQRGNRIIFVPQVVVTLATPNAHVKPLALVDSGADYSVFHTEIAQELGIRVKDHETIHIRGVGKEASGILVPVQFKLNSYDWTASVIFTSEIQPGSGLLGRWGFFEFFTITFREEDRTVEVRRNGRVFDDEADSDSNLRQ